MNILKQIGHQGDTQWYAIDEIPSEAKPTDKKFIASSERSGSVHALCGNYDMYDVEGGVVIDVKEDCILNHSFEKYMNEKALDTPAITPKKDHPHSTIVKGKYFVGIQRRFDPASGFWEEVQD
jgi:hypothetical protein